MFERKISYRTQLCTLVGALILTANGNAQTVPGNAPPMVASEESHANRIGLSPFKNGYAEVVVGSERYYINTKGEKIRPLNNDVLGDRYQVEEYEQEKEKTETLPKKKVLFEKDGQRGVLSPAGKLLLPAEYDHIDTQYSTFWSLHRGNKKTYYLPDGHILPFFDDIGYLDGEYFDVLQNGLWHLYSKSKGKIVTTNAYEGFDYCGGCGAGSSYVYAKKGGKWGIISWDEKVLVPFAFEHKHRSMRSDEWVKSFSQNGKDVIVHIPTQQVFDATSRTTDIISSMLVTSENGRFGAYNREGKLVVPFEYDELTAPNANSYRGYYGHYLIAKKENRKGVIDSEGSVALPVEYDDVSVYDDFFVTKKGTRTYLLRHGEEEPLIVQEHADIRHVNDHYYSSGSGGLSIFKVKQKAYYGLYFADHNRFYDPSFYDVSLRRSSFVEGGEIVEAERQGLKTLFDKTGAKVLPFDVQGYKAFDVRSKSLLAFKIKGKWGLYDMEADKEIVPARYDEYFKLLDSSATTVIQAFADGFKGIDLYDLEGSKLTDTALNRIDPIDNQRYFLMEKGNPGAFGYAIFDAEHQTTEDLNYPYVAALRGTGKLLMVSQNGYDGKLYDFKNRKELERWYNVYMFSVDTDVLEDSEHWLFYGFQDGYAKVQTNEGMMGYIDERGDVIIPPKYPWARMYGENYVLVSEGRHLQSASVAYFIDMEGKRVFPPEYWVEMMYYDFLEPLDMSDKVVLLKEGENGRLCTGLGDLNTGEILIPATYDELLVSTVDSSYIILSKEVADNGSSGRGTKLIFGLANTEGKMLLEPQFDAIYRPRFDTYGQHHKREPFFPLLVYQNEKWRYINEDGSYLAIEGDDVIH